MSYVKLFLKILIGRDLCGDTNCRSNHIQVWDLRLCVLCTIMYWLVGSSYVTSTILEPISAIIEKHIVRAHLRKKSEIFLHLGKWKATWKAPIIYLEASSYAQQICKLQWPEMYNQGDGSCELSSCLVLETFFKVGVASEKAYKEVSRAFRTGAFDFAIGCLQCFPCKKRL